MEEKWLNVKELSKAIGRTVPTINNWYRWKFYHKNHELARLLPNYVRMGSRNARYWKESDIPKILEFIQAMPIGRGGVMGDVTQMYIHKERKKK